MSFAAGNHPSGSPEDNRRKLEYDDLKVALYTAVSVVLVGVTQWILKDYDEVNADTKVLTTVLVQALSGIFTWYLLLQIKKSLLRYTEKQSDREFKRQLDAIKQKYKEVEEELNSREASYRKSLAGVDSVEERKKIEQQLLKLIEDREKRSNEKIEEIKSVRKAPISTRIANLKAVSDMVEPDANP